ncbi:MAG: NAD(P)-dependent oxidoreductase [Acidiferrobacterales bacterium]
MKTGVIGLGAMGGPMAANLHKAGFLHGAWNRTHERAMKLSAETGLALANSPQALARECDLIITSLSNDAALLEIIEMMSPGLVPGKIIVDTSTISVQAARQVAQGLAGAAVSFLDAPVSGGVEGARQGKLAMMVGGDASVLERVRPALSVLATKISHIGRVGSGQGTKAVNQLMVAGINQAVTESLAFGQALELPMAKVIDILSAGAASNWFLTHRGATMLREEFAPGFKVALHHKDLSICRQMAQSFGVQLPVVEMTLIHYKRLMKSGFGESDISALFGQKRSLLQHREE